MVKNFIFKNANQLLEEQQELNAIQEQLAIEIAANEEQREIEMAALNTSSVCSSCSSSAPATIQNNCQKTRKEIRLADKKRAIANNVPGCKCSTTPSACKVHFGG